MQSPGKRLAGILIPAFSTRREGDLGIGDTAGLRDWIDWAAQHNVGFLQLLPVNENGTEESPYSAISSVALDPIYLACEVAEIPGLKESDLLAARERLKAAAHSPLINYPAVRAVKRGLLETAWRRFTAKADAGLAAEFARFRESEAEWLDDYCIFRREPSSRSCASTMPPPWMTGLASSPGSSGSASANGSAFAPTRQAAA